MSALNSGMPLTPAELEVKRRYKQSAKAKATEKLWREKNKEEIKKYHAERYQKNKVAIKKQTSEYKRKQYKINSDFATQAKLRALLTQAFRRYSEFGKLQVSSKYGVDFKAICEHLGQKPEGNFQIDHIRPLCSFDFDNPDEVTEAFAPENHQWLPALENREKGGSYSA